MLEHDATLINKRLLYIYVRKYAWTWCNYNEWEIAINMKGNINRKKLLLKVLINIVGEKGKKMPILIILILISE